VERIVKAEIERVSRGRWRLWLFWPGRRPWSTTCLRFHRKLPACLSNDPAMLTWRAGAAF